MSTVSVTPQVIETRLGPVEVAVVGEGAPVLVVHGTPGGWDQAAAMARFLTDAEVADLVGRRAVSVTSDLLSLMSVAAIPLLDAWIGLGIGWLAALAVLGATPSRGSERG